MGRHLRSVRGERAAAVAEPAALFLFLDPFGYSHAPMTLTQDLVQQPKSDTLLFLPLSFVNRFKDREGQEIALDRFFGTSVWRSIPDGADRPARLLALFETQLKKVGLSYVGAFKLRPDSTNEYFIVGGSGHPKGWASIKEGFWAGRSDQRRGVSSSETAPAGSADARVRGARATGGQHRAAAGGIESQFEGRRFTVEDAMLLTEQSRFLDSHLKRARWRRRRHAASCSWSVQRERVNSRRARASQWCSDRVRRRSEHMFV